MGDRSFGTREPGGWTAQDRFGASGVGMARWMVVSLLALFAYGAGGDAHAAQITATWEGGAGSWTDATRWSGTGGSVPDDTANDTFDVRIDGGKTGTVSTVTLDTMVSIASLAIDANDGLTLDDGSILVVGSGSAGGPLTNEGDIAFQGLMDPTSLRLDGAITVDGGGTITFGSSGLDRVIGTPGTAPELVNPASHTLTIQGGSGLLGMDGLAVTNAGVLDLVLTDRLTLDPGAGGVTNTGTLRASANGGEVVVGDAFVANTGGVLEALDGATLRLASAHVAGGVLATAGSGRVVSEVATLEDVTHTGQLAIPDGLDLTLRGTFTNEGVVDLEGATALTSLRVDGAVAVGGAGTITLGSSTFDQIVGTGAAPGLLQQAGHTLRGVGTIFVDTENDGILAPGVDLGSLTFVSGLEMTANAELDIQLAGTTQGTTYDLVGVIGDVVLDGALSVSFLGGFDGAVTSADVFTVLDADGALTGSFANVANGERVTTREGHSFLVSYGAGSAFGDASRVVLSDFQAVPEPAVGALLLGMLVAGVRRVRPGRHPPSRAS